MTQVEIHARVLDDIAKAPAGAFSADEREALVAGAGALRALDSSREREEALRLLLAESFGLPLPGESYNDRFETIAAEFYRDTGFLRPGKSEPMEMRSVDHDKRRRDAWYRWSAARNAKIAQQAKEAVEALRPSDGQEKP